ncbi:MAG: HAD family hydrolase [Ruminococcaceae bacterium]|nr:HAD family hydrolase [Oscillospiraceae bacterium]
MHQLKSFIKDYDTVLLDLDGVVTSEEVYWNTAALTVWELLCSERYCGTKPLDVAAVSTRIGDIRKKVFCHDAVIKTVKKRGINNNWDLAWFVVSGALVLDTRDFEEVFCWLCALPETPTELCGAVGTALREKAGLPEDEAVHQGGLWRKVQDAFQEWFLGSALFPEYWGKPTIQEGKPGLTFGEEPLVDKEKLLVLFSLLAENVKLGIGTGRPRIEMQNPLVRWGAYGYFSPEAVVTHNEVQRAQNKLRETMPELVLTKPHPYIFLKGIFGDTVTDTDLVAGRFDRERCKKTLVIGDAGCDLLAAKAAGCDFAAVLTGIDGLNARDYFEKEGADYVLHDILELLDV